MKKSITLLAIAALPVMVAAQPDVVSAYNSNERGEYEKAAEYIEKALTNDKAVTKEKTWRYRGMIYNNIAVNEELAPRYPDALPKAYESIKKAMELDARGSYENENIVSMKFVMLQSLNTGILKYNDQAYKEAADLFELSNSVSTSVFDSTFVLAVYNAGLSYEKSGNLDKAISYYTAAAETGYLVPDIYVIMVNLLSNADRTQEALDMAKMAREKHPRNRGLILEELNIYLREGRLEEALSNLEIAVEEDPSNEILVFSKGSVLDNLGKSDEAREAYEKALEINPDFYDALYNLGAMYFNKGAEKINAANEVPPKQQKLYDQLRAEATEWFAKAQPIFERAHEIKPEDLSTVRSLRDIYARTGNDDKFLEMSKKIEGE